MEQLETEDSRELITERDPAIPRAAYYGFTIEHVTGENIAYIVGLAKELHGLGSFNTVPFDWSFCLAVMRRSVQSPHYYIRMARNADGYCGAVVGHVEAYFFAPRLFGIENAWYVRESTPFRAKIAMKLMTGFVDWAMLEKKADHVQSGDVANINPLAVDTLYKRLGFKRYGSIYRYGGE